MAKVKNKKKNLSENVHNKKEQKQKKTLNPFEVHINKEKIRVLGRKQKNDRGLPGISRAKALKKRKHTLLPEYKLQHKSNQFTDRRIGERNNDLSAEDKSMARFTAVRVKTHGRKSIFNLADDEVLTHRGQTLSEIEKFDDPRSDDDDDRDDDEPRSGNLESKFVGDAHFGGGMFKKGDGFKSHKDLIDQLIAESKKRKFEKQKQKEATLELTEKLDTDWKDLLPLVSKNTKRKDEVIEVKKDKIDDYDKVMRELKFEARGTPSDKLKTEDEIAREEKEKLEKLERERLERMHGTFNDNKPKLNHRSADDLDDNFAYDDLDDTPDVTLSYDDGKSNIQLETDQDKEEIENEAEESDGDEEIETDSEDNLSDLKESDSENDEDENIVDKSDEDEDIENDKSDEVVSSEEDVEEAVISKQKVPEKRKLDQSNDDDPKKAKLDSDRIMKDLLLRKEMMEKARSELPYTYSLPENYESFQEVVTNQPSHHQGVIVERMIKCNHASLNPANKDGLGMLLVYILQHLSDISNDTSDIKECFQIFSHLTPHIYDLAQMDPKNAHTCMLEVIKEKQNAFRKSTSNFPKLDVLLYLKLVSVLLTTSDFRHQVITPCLIFMEQMLTRCRIKSSKDVAYGLFVTTLIAEYTSLSKRYSPASIRYLSGLIHMALPKAKVRTIKVLPPFRHNSSDLVVLEEVDTADLKLSITDLTTTEYDDSFRIRCMNASVGLLKRFYVNLQSLPSCVEIFETAFKYLKQLPLDKYPKSLNVEISGLLNTLQEYNGNRKLDYVVLEKKRPKALRLYEPNVVKIYDGKRFKVQSREKAERDKLLHKLKKEKKGALREIRRDKAFLGRVKINQRIQSDVERRDKVKRIYSEAAIQQSELNTLDRKNSKKK